MIGRKMDHDFHTKKAVVFEMTIGRRKITKLVWICRKALLAKRVLLLLLLGFMPVFVFQPHGSMRLDSTSSSRPS
jgi:hypothetical protein